jgi:hypothetical protein
MHRRVTGRVPEPDVLARLEERLAAFRARYEAAPQDAERLLAIGQAPPRRDVPAAEIAAWTLIASALFNLDAALCRG